MIKWLLNNIPRPVLIRLSNRLMPYVEFFFRGNRFTDPINGKSYRKFFSYGYEQLRPNVLSPGTLSLERHRALWLFLERKTDFFTKRQIKVLHIAPEQAFYKRFKRLFGENYITADLDSPLAEVKADLTALPFRDNEFDVIFCNHVLEHIPDDRKAMQELYRVMKPGGYGIFQIPLDASRPQTFEDPSVTNPKKRAELFGQYDHVRIYGTDYFERLQSAGFHVIPYPVKEFTTPEEIKRYALDQNEIIPFVKK